MDRQDLREIFRDPAADFVAIWLEPGVDPVATSRQSEELRKELKAIGYIQ